MHLWLELFLSLSMNNIGQNVDSIKTHFRMGHERLNLSVFIKGLKKIGVLCDVLGSYRAMEPKIKTI